MKETVDFGAIFVGGIVFIIIFYFVDLFYENVWYNPILGLLTKGMIASWAYLYWPRGNND